ncbi:MAG: hypothetical protein MUF64_24295 [Polyangiaceae bacterium]|jgi:hypothetical protein|nr:hypothetical protein [Polyangiaceae bacterium]
MRSPVFLAVTRRLRGLSAALALHRRSPALAGAALSLALAGVSVQADASLHLEVTLDHLVRVSDVALEGIPQDAQSQWEEIPGGGRRIVTYTRVKVAQKAYGDAGQEVWVRTLGGQVGDIGQRVEGEAALVPGERSVLFLKASQEGPLRVVEMAQGQYLVRKEDKTERLKLSPYLGKILPSRDEKERARAARVLLHDRALGEAMGVIRQARKDAGR